MSIDREPKPNKHTGLRVGLAALGLLSSACAVDSGKTVIYEASKQKAAVSEKQPG